MNIEVKSKNENLSLSRVEVTASLSYDKATPAENDVKVALAKALEIEPTLLVIKGIIPKFGSSTASVTAYQYISEDEMKQIEPTPKKEEKKKENK